MGEFSVRGQGGSSMNCTEFLLFLYFTVKEHNGVSKRTLDAPEIRKLNAASADIDTRASEKLGSLEKFP